MPLLHAQLKVNKYKFTCIKQNLFSATTFWLSDGCLLNTGFTLVWSDCIDVKADQVFVGA